MKGVRVVADPGVAIRAKGGTNIIFRTIFPKTPRI